MSPRARMQPVRRYTASETLHAIARTLGNTRPGGIGLACPQEILSLFTRTDSEPVRLVLAPHHSVHRLRRWADALSEIRSITAEASAAGDGDVLIVVTGRIPRGPVIAIQSWVRDFPVSLHPSKALQLTLAELHALDGAL